jgi:hypothetical protein
MNLIYIILIGVICILGYIIYNLSTKNSKLQSIYEEDTGSIPKIYEQLRKSFLKMQELDRLGAFEADDETGYIFAGIKRILLDLNKDYQFYGEEEETQEG